MGFGVFAPKPISIMRNLVEAVVSIQRAGIHHFAIEGIRPLSRLCNGVHTVSRETARL